MIGVYVHIPFCKSRCRYCDFYSTTLLYRRKEYVEALLREIELRGVHNPDTIYLGGGTPSVLEAEDIERILEAIGTDKAEEVTIEMNPGDLVTVSGYRLAVSGGINRVSIGVQSFQDQLLRTIGRRHTAEEAREAIRVLRETGIKNLSLDLMYGLPGQTLELWKADIEEAIRTGAEHISCYCLSYEEGTPMWQDLQAGRIRETDEETENAMYDYLCEQLRAAGYEHYEVSNFAKPGYRAVHNSRYWNDTPYIGLGAGAHSYDGQRRSWNPGDIERYIETFSGAKDIKMARDLYVEEEVLTDEQKRIERIMLGLRTCEGIEKGEGDPKNQQIFRGSPGERLKVKGERLKVKGERFIKEGLLREEGDRLIATQKGLHILNRIIEELI